MFEETMQDELWAELPPRTKRCSACHEWKALSDFNRRSTSADGRQWNCRACNTKWHAENKEHHNRLIHARNSRIRDENRRQLFKYLEGRSCADCGETDIVVLEFDHLRDKTEAVSKLMTWASWARVLSEIEKCELVCANCHRRRTARRAGTYRVLRLED